MGREGEGRGTKAEKSRQEEQRGLQSHSSQLRRSTLERKVVCPFQEQTRKTEQECTYAGAWAPWNTLTPHLPPIPPIKACLAPADAPICWPEASSLG